MLFRSGPESKRLAENLRFDSRRCNPYQSILARAIEVVYAFEEGLRILEAIAAKGLRGCPSQVPYTATRETGDLEAGNLRRGVSATEAPRGLIFHRYEIDDAGQVVFAKIVPPTSQNQARIEADLRQLLGEIHGETDPSIALACERLVRCYDPCISCSTHFLKVNIERT